MAEPESSAPGSRENPIPRPATRVLLVDKSDRLLLFLLEDPRASVPRLWVTAGGGLELGEDWESAGLRELREETGLAALALGPWVWTRRHVFRLGDEWWASDERFFLARVESHLVTSDGHTELERAIMRQHRWWSLAELEAARDEVFMPRALASFLAPLLAGQIPVPPLEVGE